MRRDTTSLKLLPGHLASHPAPTCLLAAGSVSSGVVNQPSACLASCPSILSGILCHCHACLAKVYAGKSGKITELGETEKKGG